jgi:heme-degrading monooxygenase HmoA
LILEVVTWEIKPSLEKEFELAFEKAQNILSNAKSYKPHQFYRCIEKSNKYVLLVNWEILEDHTEGFRKSDEYLEYRSLIHQYYQPGAVAEHYTETSYNKRM